MFVHYYRLLCQQVQSVEDTLRTTDAARELLATRHFHPLQITNDVARDAALQLKYHAPDPTTWRTLDHAAAVTALYASYERFVYDLLRDWLGLIPAFYPSYNGLRSSVHKAHRDGIANVLQKIAHRRYHHLSLAAVLRDLAAAIDGVSPYTLLPEAFFSEDDNLRREPLEKLFARIGIDAVWTWIEGHPAVVDFIEDVRGAGSTAESELSQFVYFRNDAAHGIIDTVLGLNALLDLCSFVRALGEALVELVRHRAIERALVVGHATAIGRITEVFHQGATAIGTMEPCTLRVQDEFALIADDRCPIVTVLSLRDNDADRALIDATARQEVGIRFNVQIRINMKIIRISMPLH